MLFTALVLLIYSLVLLAGLTAWGAGLWCGLKLVKADSVTWRSILLVTVVSQLLGCLLGIGALFVAERPSALTLTLLPGGVILSWLCTLAMISRFFRITLLESVMAWAPTLVPTPVMIVLLKLLFVPFCIESFVLSGNSLAPTLRGPHLMVTCPQCGGPAIARLPDPQFPGDREPVDAICQRFHVTTNITAPDSAPLPPDHVLSVKFLRPRRWEFATFRYPEDPRQTYISRIVGLPGETVFIAEDAVWVNGEKLTPPQELADITYVDKMGWNRIRMTRESPAKLGPDEYFVLGDFSINANDSRVWSKGAPGHPPFAVPEDQITGRVTHIYWPPSRWRKL